MWHLSFQMCMWHFALISNAHVHMWYLCFQMCVVWLWIYICDISHFKCVCDISHFKCVCDISHFKCVRCGSGCTCEHVSLQMFMRHFSFQMRIYTCDMSHFKCVWCGSTYTYVTFLISNIHTWYVSSQMCVVGLHLSTSVCFDNDPPTYHTRHTYERGRLMQRDLENESLTRYANESRFVFTSHELFLSYELTWNI